MPAASTCSSAPGTYLIETPIVVARSNVAIQGYTFGFAYPPFNKGKDGNPTAGGKARRACWWRRRAATPFRSARRRA